MSSISLFLIITNILVSWRGFRDHAFLERYQFEVDRILLNKEYYRLFTSAFLHVNWMHLLFNMFSLYFFSGSLEAYFGILPFLLVYVGSLLAGNLFSLFVHRNHGGYQAVGASGAVCGLIFASIAVFPGMYIGLFFLPSIPAWIYGLLFVGVSIWGIRSRRDNVGHEAHLAGSLAGMLIALLIYPAALSQNTLVILAIAIPTILVIYTILTRPHLLLIDNLYFKKQQRFYSVDHRYNAKKIDEQKEVDAILEKIHRRGMRSLSKKERDILARYSKTVR